MTPPELFSCESFQRVGGWEEGCGRGKGLASLPCGLEPVREGWCGCLPADGEWARLGLCSRSLWHWGHKLLPATELPHGAWGGCTLGMGPLRYQPLSATVKPFRGNAVSLLLSVCGFRTRERNCCYMNTSNYMGFVFIQLLAFWNILGEKKTYLPWLYYSPKPRFYQTLFTINLQKLHHLLEKSSMH